jgi:hypothetical protein
VTGLPCPLGPLGVAESKGSSNSHCSFVTPIPSK